MKKVIIIAGLAITTLAAKSQINTEFSFIELKAKTEYSSKYCTSSNLMLLCEADNAHNEPVYSISSVWLYGAIAYANKARTIEVFKEYAKRSSYTQVSALINEFKAFQNDACYKIYLDMQPDIIDIQWLKLQVKDTAMSNLFVAR